LVQCLAGQLNQVFMNLIVNASQAIDGHGTITLASGAQNGWAWVQVRRQRLPACPRKCGGASSSPSSPPRTSARAPAWACR
jgi:hypothetical protein